MRTKTPTRAKALGHRSGGTALRSGGTDLRSGGTAFRSGGTALRSGGTALRSGGTALRSGGTALQRCPHDPFALFKKWFRDAQNAGEPLPEAMALATATRGARPSVRVVLNRGVSRGGFVFFTNYNSRKAAELRGNPFAALAFHWPALERQVRVEGRVRKLTRRESEAYFQTRPRESQLSAWASPQSSSIAGRSVLEEEFTRVQARFGAHTIPCPPFWGGYRVVADCIEFWQGQPHRLHDRVLYRRRGKTWTNLRLAP
jgi:pyridoxamine 5'-phosphate oxidase